MTQQTTTTNCLTIGFERLDGDFQVLATLNNNDELIEKDKFDAIVTYLLNTFDECFSEEGYEVVALDRQDAPDYISIDEGE